MRMILRPYAHVQTSRHRTGFDQTTRCGETACRTKTADSQKTAGEEGRNGAAQTQCVQGASDEEKRQAYLKACEGLEDEREACTEDERPWAADYGIDELYAFDFVTQELLAPEAVVDPTTRTFVAEHRYADDDPSGIATYSQSGAQFGYALS